MSIAPLGFNIKLNWHWDRLVIHINVSSTFLFVNRAARLEEKILLHDPLNGEEAEHQ
jgi:hypothetical protein